MMKTMKADFNSLSLVLKLLLQIRASLAIAAVAVAILICTSAVHEPSLDSVAPKYLKEVTIFKTF
jgi:hypothetical protein